MVRKLVPKFFIDPRFYPCVKLSLDDWIAFKKKKWLRQELERANQRIVGQRRKTIRKNVIDGFGCTRTQKDTHTHARVYVCV